jgi:hypothetical protein
MLSKRKDATVAYYDMDHGAARLPGGSQAATERTSVRCTTEREGQARAAQLEEPPVRRGARYKVPTDGR